MGDLPRSLSLSPPPPPPLPIPVPWSLEVLFEETPDGLPEPLPSLEDIENAANRIGGHTSKCIVALNDHYVAKLGVCVEPLEAENMRFVREHTTVHVPKVFAVYQRDIGDRLKKTYIVMERIHGHTLQDIWGDLEAPEKISIAAQLRSAMQAVREIPHSGYFGSLDGSKLRDEFFWATEPVPAVDRIFPTEEEFLSGVIDKYLYDSGDTARHRVDFYRRVLPNVLMGNGKPVFTHGGFQRKNIMITPQNTVVLLDWAASGWYPSYWEYAVTIYVARRWDDDWHVYIGKILEEFPNHFAWMQTLHIEMWGF